MNTATPTILKSALPSHARGAVMTEALLCLPFILMILAFLMYFGLSFQRLQHAQVMDRYEAWRQVSEAPGPGVNDPDAHAELNAAFYGGNAQSIGYGGNNRAFPTDAQEDQVDASARESNEAGDLHERIFDNLPHGRTVSFSTNYDNNVPLLQSMEGPMRHGHTRFGNDWRFVNGWPRDPLGGSSGSRVSHTNVVADEYFQQIDQQMNNLGNNPYANMVKSLYRSNPDYQGPNVN